MSQRDPREVLPLDRRLLGCPKCGEKDWDTAHTPYANVFKCRKCGQEWSGLAAPKDDPTAAPNRFTIPGINPYQKLQDWDEENIDLTPDFRKYGRDYYGDDE